MGSFATFHEQRPLLFSIAYRMLGQAADAEDMIQETFLRWQKVADGEVESPRGFLSTVITRLCIDHLRSAQKKREDYVGPWLPEPIVTEEPQELADSLTMAFLVLLESLSPVERAAFLLREVFDYDYDEVARIVEKSEANCRQLVSRAREHIGARRSRFTATAQQRDRLVRQFMETCANGDLEALEAMLAEEVTLMSDGGGKEPAALNPIHGPVRVAKFLAGVTKKAQPGLEPRVVSINGQPGLILSRDGRARSAVILDFDGGRIRGVYIVVNPEKLVSL